MVMTQEEVRRVPGRMQGTHLLMAKLLHGCGLRLGECIRLGVKDIDFEGERVVTRFGKGGKDRVTP